jgi:O-antigen/teichoic acid export membrane protein
VSVVPTNASSADGREALWGTARIFAADLLLLPAGIITAAYLSRTLGPGGYGLYSLAAAIVIWLEWTISAVFTRATFTLVAEADDWRPIGATVNWAHLVAGLAVAIVVAASAGPVSSALGAPDLAHPLRLFSVDIPIACVAAAHRNLLVGVRRYGMRATASVARVVARTLLIIALVASGMSVDGVILGVILSSAVELLVARIAVRPAWRRDPSFALRRLGEVAVPLLLYTASVRLLDKLDILALQGLGGSVAQVGVYAAAQNLAIAPGLFAAALSSLLLTMLGRLRRDDEHGRAHALARGALRTVVLLVPFAALVAGGAGVFVRVIFGAEFTGAIPLVALLIFAATGMLMLAVTSAILTAGGWSYAAVWVITPLVVASTAGYLVAIPRFGAIGAASVTTFVAIAGALGSMVAVHRMWSVAPPAGSVMRSAIVSIVVFAAARRAGAGEHDLIALGVLTLFGVLIPVLYVLTGELTRREAALVRLSGT